VSGIGAADEPALPHPELAAEVTPRSTASRRRCASKAGRVNFVMVEGVA